ncbi:TPA: O-antigen ligase family protein, partial [Salmonella enterica subsp. enterica serovar Anatum]|nr:O-antigen ligase family protein [Salmonella enterica subsp. enterica serovar Anatum]
VFSFFASLILLLIIFTSTYTIQDDDTVTAIIKSILGISFLIISSIFSYEKTNSIDMLKIIHRYISAIILFCFIQVVFLHIQSGGYGLTASNSYTASFIFDSDYALFGGNDKNMFGAKVALFGILQYILHKTIYKKGAVIWMLIVLITGFLSMSRTPVAFLIAILALYKITSSRGVAMKMVAAFFVITALAIASPYIFDYLRLSSINQGQLSDGMSIRILYWIAVISNTDVIGLFGNGLLSARDFLPKYSAYYNGEPNVHNLYLNTYLDLGAIGAAFYIAMIISLFIYLKNLNPQLAFVFIASSFVMSCTLYTAYDIEMWCFLSLSVVISRLIRTSR